MIILFCLSSSLWIESACFNAPGDGSIGITLLDELATSHSTSHTYRTLQYATISGCYVQLELEEYLYRAPGLASCSCWAAGLPDSCTTSHAETQHAIPSRLPRCMNHINRQFQTQLHQHLLPKSHSQNPIADPKTLPSLPTPPRRRPKPVTLATRPRRLALPHPRKPTSLKFTGVPTRRACASQHMHLSFPSLAVANLAPSCRFRFSTSFFCSPAQPYHFIVPVISSIPIEYHLHFWGPARYAPRLRIGPRPQPRARTTTTSP